MPNVFSGSRDINAVYADDRFLYTAGDDKLVRVWDTNNDFAPVTDLVGHTGNVIAVHVDERYIYSASSDGTMRVWRKPAGNIVIQRSSGTR